MHQQKSGVLVEQTDGILPMDYGRYVMYVMDKFVGGVGLRRGRTNINTLHAGDALDFWRVLYANKEEGRLLLFAEMKVPGEAWLEIKITNNELVQTASFRPLGLLGRMYWYSLIPAHGVIFGGMLKKLAKEKNRVLELKK
ncbi:MAG: DUF2867 domain-containing protein [Dysgonamonadaceae bacterium]|nr:DUF2867 domain-containing protein [Dysgonamonadaceae bacterium]MDD4729593.1 DUF2867 domain-containing protein [Dysgonamonadaceae bacterium]